jgi:DNA processing protein
VTLGVGRAGPLGPARFAASGIDVAAGSWAAASPPSIDEREALAVLVSAEGVGPTTLSRLLDAFGSAREVLNVARRPDGTGALVAASRGTHNDGTSSAALLTSTSVQLVVAAAHAADTILEGVRAARLSVVTLDDADYPARLRAIDLPPHVLFVRGDPDSLHHGRSVAVVGTRRPTEVGRRVASRIASALARTGATVVSGLAVGIDGAAHAVVVAEREAAGTAPSDAARDGPMPSVGVTVAVLGGGHDRLFPRGHRRLADRIVDSGGALVSEFAPETRPSRGTFPRRNRIISGLAEATIVVEARVRSGALITAAWALQQGRGCYLVPGRIDDPTSSGCLAFLREASPEARVVESVDTLLEDLGLAVGVQSDGPAAAGPLSPLVELGETARMVGEQLVRGRVTADELVAASGLPIASVLAALTLLEVRGLAVGAYGRYRPAGRLAGVGPARPEVR